MASQEPSIPGRVRSAEERLVYASYVDRCTGLYSRPIMTGIVAEAVRQAGRVERGLGLVAIDLDGFGQINDSFGIEAGDTILRESAARLRTATRDEDVIGRYGADEFIIVLPGLQQATDIPLLVEKIMLAFDPPFIFGGQPLYITASIGSAFYPNDGASAEEVLRNATTALHTAKSAGVRQHQAYSNDLGDRTKRRVLIASQLREALEAQQFVLHHQPQISLADHSLIGLEGLLRWQHPVDGLIMPGAFLPVAESSDLILPLGQQALAIALRDIKLWKAAGRQIVPVTVNISSRQIIDPTFAGTVEEMILAEGIDPADVRLELTESMLVTDVARALETVTHLRRFGVSFSLDDFGTGYSSLISLQRFPIQVLKIDKSFVNGLTWGDAERSIVKAIIGLAHNLNMKVVAEGVETEPQLQILTDLGCEAVQGFFFARALPPSQIQADWLRPQAFAA
jgi:diguanylate cyclase (GGDEF)-like protein